MHTSPTPTPTSEMAGPIALDGDEGGAGDGTPASSPKKDLSIQDMSPLTSAPCRDSREDFNSTDKEDFSNSQLCIDDDFELGSPGSPISLQTMPPPSTLTTPPGGSLPASQSAFGPPRELQVDYHGGVGGLHEGGNENRTGGQRGWLDGLLGCLRPVWTIIGKAASNEIKMQGKDEWEIAFEDISDLQWLGSGAQGAVFQGRFNGDFVAVKKVRDQQETDIKHLRKLNHPNITTFKGVCTQAPCYCIVMEFCPYGPLYELLKKGHEIPPAQMTDWAKQIASGMNYLHAHKIIHRDLKSPNVLIGTDEIVKISDFGTSRQWNEISTKMSFAGTVAWMAPEIIRNEPCSEKVDIWSFGVVLWELLTCETPYKDVDSTAIIWGVGSHSLHLPVPTTCPDGFKLLMKQCWSSKPRNRPSFRHILMHLDIAAVEILSFPKETYFQTQASWREEIRQHMQKIPSQSTHLPQMEEDLVRRRREELRHAQDIREHYERKLERANSLYMELSACLLQLEQREKEIVKREQQVQSVSNNMSKCHRKRIVRPIIKAQERLNKKRNSKSPLELISPESPTKFPPQQQLTPTTEQHSSPCSPSYHPSSAKIRSRKTRHRRTGSQGGSGNYGQLADSGNNTPRVSPNRDRKATVVDSETQTETMDISETDTSPNPVGEQGYHLSIERAGFVLGLTHDELQQRSSPSRPPTSPEEKSSSSAGHGLSSSERERRRRMKCSKQSGESLGVASERPTPPRIQFDAGLRGEFPRLRKLSLENNNGEEVMEIPAVQNVSEVDCDHSNGNSQQATTTEDLNCGDGDRTISINDQPLPTPVHSVCRKRSADNEGRVKGDDEDNGSLIRTSSSSIICVPNTCSLSVSTSTVAVSTTSGYRGSSCLGLDSEGDALDEQEDSWSEEEGEVDDSDDCVLRRKKRNIVMRLNRHSMQSNSTFSSEGNLSEEENTSEYSSRNTPSSRLSTLSNPDVGKTLDHYGSLPSDGLSEKERAVQHVKRQAALSAVLDKFPAVSSSASSSSETEDNSDMTVAANLPPNATATTTTTTTITTSTETTVW